MSNIYEYIINNNKSKNYIVFGDGGAGKTTIARHFNEYALNSDRKILPLFVDAKECYESSDNPLFSYIINTYGPTSKKQDFDLSYFFSHQFEQYGYEIYLIIDSFNEADTHLKSNILNDVCILNDISSHLHIIVVSRNDEQLYPEFKDYLRIKIHDLTNSQIEAYLKKKYNQNVDSDKFNSSLIATLRHPIFLVAFAYVYKDESFPDLYNEKTVNQSDILFAYINKLFKDSEISKLGFKEEKRFLLERFIPALAFNISQLDKLSVTESEYHSIKQKLCKKTPEGYSEYFDQFLDSEESDQVKNFLEDTLDPTLRLTRQFSLLKKSGRGKKAKYSFSHQMYQELFAAIHINNILSTESFEELELPINKNIRQRLGEICKKNGKPERDYKSVLPNNTKESISPLSDFLNEHGENSDTPLSTIAVKQVIETMKVARDNKISSKFNGIDLKDVRFDNCSLPYSVFVNSKVYSDNFCSDGHSGYVYDVKVVNNNIIASSGKDGTVRLWNYKQGKQIKVAKIHSDYASSLAMCDDNTCLISAGYDDIAIKLDSQTLTHVGEPFVGHSNRINCVDVSNDNKFVATASDDGNVIIFDNVLDTHSIVTIIAQHTAPVNSVIFSNDNRYVISGGNDGIINVYDIEKGISVGSDGDEPLTKIIVNDWSSKSLVTISNHNEIKCLAQYKDYIISGHQNGTIKFWCMSKDSLSLTFEIRPHNESIESISVYQDLLVSAGYEGNIHLFNIPKKSNYGFIHAHGDWINSVCVSNKGEIFTAGGDQCIGVFDINTLNRIYEPLQGASGWTNALVYDSTNGHLYCGGDDARLRVFDVSKNALKFNPQEVHRARINAIAIAPNNEFFVAAGDDGTIKEFDAATSCLIDETTDYNNNWVRSLAITPDSKLIIAGKWNGNVSFYDSKSLQIIDDSTIHDGSIESICISSDAKYVYFASDDHSISAMRRNDTNYDSIKLKRKIDLSGKLYLPFKDTLSEHTDRIRALVLTDEDQYLFSAGWDGNLCKYDVNEWKLVKSIHAHNARIDALALLSQLGYIVTGSDDGTLKVFDKNLDEIKVILTDTLSCISTICVSKDEKYIYAGGEGGKISIIETETFSVINTITQLDINIFGADLTQIKGIELDEAFIKVMRENGAII